MSLSWTLVDPEAVAILTPNEKQEVDEVYRNFLALPWTPIERMVCDWTAMSQEFGQDGGSARGWADKTIGNRQNWHEDQCQFVYDAIDLLDANLIRSVAIVRSIE